jgi:hypothetical protein
MTSKVKESTDMAIIRKDRHVLPVIKHLQPFGEYLYEVEAPKGYKWSGDTWSIHGDSLSDLRERVKYTGLEEADDDEDLA